MEIEVLSRQGKGIRAIARELSISRNAVRTTLRGAGDQTYGPCQPRPTKLHPFHDYLRERISAAGATRLTGIVSNPSFALKPHRAINSRSISSCFGAVNFLCERSRPRLDIHACRTSSTLITSGLKPGSAAWNERCRGSAVFRVTFCATILRASLSSTLSRFRASLRRQNQTLPTISSANQRKS